MPNVNPYEPGDDIFEQYGLTKTHKVKTGVEIIKGEVYTKDNNGYLIVPVVASNIAGLLHGIFQAKDSVPAKTFTGAENAPTVQCLVKGSWIILKAPANIVEGARVKIATTAATTGDFDKVEGQSSSSANFPLDTLGTVYQILTVDADENPKLKTAADDLVVVQTGVI